MNILFFKKAPTTMSTMLSYTLSQELILRGHNAYFADQIPPDDSIKNYFDWVYIGGNNAPAKEGLAFSKEIGAKCHIHLEGVACWRVGLETARQWGYEKELPNDEIEAWKEHYRSWMKYAYEADSCSVNGEFQKNAVETSLFDGKPLPNCHMMSCGADARYALTLPNSNKMNYMVTASRLEENKKVFMIAEALAILKRQGVDIPVWVVVGYGSDEQIQRLYNITKKDGIKFILNPGFGAKKWRWVKQAQIMLQGCSGVPPAEGLLCDVPVLSFASESVKELYDDSIYLAENNNIGEYASKIMWMLQNPDTAMEKTKYGKAKLLNGELFACTQEQLAIICEGVFI